METEPAPASEQGGGALPRPPVGHLVLDEGPDAVARCRVFVRRCLESGGWPAELAGEERRQAVEDVLLLASEIVTNACLHADGPRRLTVSAGSRTVRVEVADGSAVPPVLRPAGGIPCGDGRFGGHGMRIVDRLTGGRWGSEPDQAGKTVWFEVIRPEPPPP